MIEMLKTKSIILLAVMILGTCFITALDNKKADGVTSEKSVNLTNDLYNK